MSDDTINSWEWEYDDDGNVISTKLETQDDIIKALQKRRKGGGCSMWRGVGLKWISDNKRWDLLKYKWEWDFINKHYRNLNEEQAVRKTLKIEIPDNPYDGVEDYEDELYADEDGFDDEDERLDADDWKLIKQELENTKWKDKALTLEEYFKNNQEGILRGFYCYVIGCMNDEGIKSYMDGYRTLIKQYFTDKQNNEIPKEVKKDYVTMDFKKQQIEQHAERLSNEVMEDLFLMLDSPYNNS